MSFYDQLEKLCKKEGITPTALVLEAGMSKGTMSNWKKGGIPNGDAIVRFSERFGVSTDYLLLGKDSVGTLSSEEQDILDLIRALPEKHRWEVKGYLEHMVKIFGTHDDMSVAADEEIPPEVAAK